MEFVREQKDTALSQALILELHRIVCEGTLDNAMAAGRLRRPDEDVHVVDNGDGTILHTPPPAEELVERLERLCRFANDRSDSGPYLHPVVRAVLIHFMIGYDHPFVDGNGRTARALFYWSMARQGYWLMEYVPISRLIKKAPSQYSRAYLYTETDDNDATYFILHQLRIIRRAIDDLHVYLARRGAELRTVEQVLRRSRRWRDQLNHRQISLLEHALRHPGAQYLIAAHGRAHRVTNGTANADLRHLARQGLLEQTRHGRAFVFIAPPDLEELLKSSG
jgi:Fic family protein